ncbi:MAG: FAD-dependent oxidoreductase [Solirubrobacteraceae bacterium]|nr:FAD-dependent oxidoreductase [Solirubrobacteraceae bacterium]
MESQGTGKHRVVIVGGGVAALEAALALQQLAPDSTTRTVVAPNAEYVVYAQTVREPFAHADADHYPVAPIVEAAGASLIVDALDRVDVDGKRIVTTGGQELEYDTLVLALGSKAAPCYDHALTVDPRSMAPALQRMLEGVDAGTIRSVAFVTPAGPTWPLPLYELAYLTARRASAAGHKLLTTLTTPEDRPMMRFGMIASNGVTRLLHEGGVELITSSVAEVLSPHELVITPGERRLRVDCVVALPELVGPGISGVPQDEHGFIPVDEYGRVIGAPGVFAAGDVTARPIKHGGFSSQQADAVAETIAADVGEILDPQPVEALLRGMFITGEAPLYLSARVVGGHAYDSVFTTEPTATPEGKIAARYLSQHLEQAA